MNNKKDAVVIEIIGKIIADYGIEVFEDKKRAGALVADYFTDNTMLEEKLLLKRVLASGVINLIVDNLSDDYTAARQKALYILTEQEFIAKSWAERALMWFDIALEQYDDEDDDEMDFIERIITATEELEDDDLDYMYDEFVSAIDKIMDENNNDNIVLYSEDNEKIEFEQVAVVPYNDKVYPILKPVTEIPGIADDEALVFVIEEIDHEDCLIIEQDDSVVDKVFEEYYKMLRAEGIDIN